MLNVIHFIIYVFYWFIVICGRIIKIIRFIFIFLARIDYKGAKNKNYILYIIEGWNFGFKIVDLRYLQCH